MSMMFTLLLVAATPFNAALETTLDSHFTFSRSSNISSEIQLKLQNNHSPQLRTKIAINNTIELTHGPMTLGLDGKLGLSNATFVGFFGPRFTLIVGKLSIDVAASFDLSDTFAPSTYASIGGDVWGLAFGADATWIFRDEVAEFGLNVGVPIDLAKFKLIPKLNGFIDTDGTLGFSVAVALKTSF